MALIIKLLTTFNITVSCYAIHFPLDRPIVKRLVIWLLNTEHIVITSIQNFCSSDNNGIISLC